MTESPLPGRAFAAYNAARNTAELGAVGAGGVLVSALGPRAALLLAGLGPILAAVTGLIALRQPRRRKSRGARNSPKHAFFPTPRSTPFSISRSDVAASKRAS